MLVSPMKMVRSEQARVVHLEELGSFRLYHEGDRGCRNACYERVLLETDCIHALQ